MAEVPYLEVLVQDVALLAARGAGSGLSPPAQGPAHSPSCWIRIWESCFAPISQALGQRFSS